jgi:hypothetical protein
MWREILQADVEGVLSAPELAAYQAAALAEAQDPMADAITAVVNQCRGYIADHASNQLAEGLTLPERVHLSALHLIRVEVLTRLDIEVSKDRADAKRDAIRFFERVADGRVAIESPTGTVESSGSGASVETLASRDRIADRSKLSGL